MKSRIFAVAALIVGIVIGFSTITEARSNDAKAYYLLTPDWYLADLYGNYGYHKLYVSWSAWLSNNTTSSYSEMKTTMVSPSSGYHYDSWAAKQINGPVPPTSYYIESFQKGAARVDYYTNNPMYVSTYWGQGWNNHTFTHFMCSADWCHSSALADWGAWIAAAVASGASSGVVTSYGR